MSTDETIQQNKKRVEETANQNILIAVFMGAEIVDAALGKAVRLKNEYFPEADGRSYGQLSPYVLKYHISWDWLMPVVEKIEETARVDVYGKACKISQPQLFNPDIAHINESKIMAVWVCVVQFINFYNQNQSK